MATRDEVMQQIDALLRSGDVNLDSLLSNVPAEGILQLPTRRDLNLQSYDSSFGGQAAPAAPPIGEKDLPLWQKALMTLDRPRSAIAGAIDQATDGERSSFGSVAGAAWNGLSGRSRVSSQDIFDNLGWTEMESDPTKQGFGEYLLSQINNKSRSVAGLVTDIATDPLTYLTFGAGSATKAGTAAGTKEAARLGIRTPGGNIDPAALLDNLTEQYVKKGASPALAERAAAAKMPQIESIANKAAAARNKSQNSLINFDVPFTNITKGIGRKPGFLAKTEAKIGPTARTEADVIIKSMGRTEAEITRAYGIRSLDDMNTQQFAHLQEQAAKSPTFSPRVANDGTLKNNLRDFQTTSKEIGRETQVDYKAFDPEEFLQGLTRSLGDTRIADSIAPFIRSMSVEDLRKQGPESLAMFRSALKQLPGKTRKGERTSINKGLNLAVDKVGDVTNTATLREVPIMQQILSEIEKVVPPAKQAEFSKFIQDMGGRSKVGNAIGKVTDVFNTRTLRSKEGVVNEAAGKLRSTDNIIHSGIQSGREEVAAIKKVADDAGLTADQTKAIPYIMEGEFPTGFDMKSITPDMRKVAKQMSATLKRIGDEGVRTGTLDSLKKGYFPHVITNMSDETKALLDKYANDPKLGPLIGKSSNDVFNRERKSFDTFARLDNALAELGNARTKPNLTPEALAEITEKETLLQNLFERDPFEALAKRQAKSVKANAMKDLYGRFSRDGLIASPEKAAAISDITRNPMMEKLDDKVAKSLGIAPGSFIHKEIAEALRKVDQIFTNDGFQKFIDNMESIQNIWRTGVTSVIPSHYWNNFVGNVFNNALAGVGMKSYNRAGRIIDAHKAGTMTKSQEKVLKMARDNGIMRESFTADFTRTGQGPENKLGRLETRIRDSKLPKFLRNKAGQPVDNLTRLAHFIDKLEKTGSSKLAADSVRTHLFNYHEMTGFDKVVRLAVPFWNWMKNNIPLQVEKLAQQPRFYAAYLRAKEKSQEGADKSNMPAYMQESFFGNQSMYDPYLPLNDLNGVFGNEGLDPLRMALGGLTPAAKIPFEVLLNKNAFTGKTIDYKREYQGGIDPQAWAKYAASQLGKGGRTAYNALDGEGNVGMDILNLINPIGSPVELRKEGQ